MNTFYKYALCLVMFVAVLPAHAQSFVEGTHYSVISAGSLSSTDEVVEYFSFSCPGCYAIEPTLNALQKARPSIPLRKVHMPFGGRNAKYSQQAFVLMQLLNVTEHTDKIFSRIHTERNLFSSSSEVIDYFVTLGFERDLVEKTSDSFAADTMIRTMNQQGQKSQISSVPSIVINRKYLVELKWVNSANDLANLIDYLLKLDK